MDATRLDGTPTRLDRDAEATRLDRPAGERTLPDPSFAPAADPAHLYRLPAALRDKFRIVRVLPASGAEAEIMILEGAKSAVKVVAKIYRPGIVPKFEVLERVREVAHAHVVHIVAHGVSDGVAYEVMEYCAEGSLRELLKDGPLPPDLLRAVVKELAEAVAALQACDVVHRDLKPENVLVRRREPLDLVLTDFGIASVQEATQLFTDLARTVKYGAPETLSGVLDRAADWWSLGMMVLEALRGEHPFAGLSEPVITHRLATSAVDLSAVADPAWRKLCRGLLLRDPKQRWGIAQVRRWLDGDPTLAEPREEAGGAVAAVPYQLEDSECRTPFDLALALARHWQAGRKDLKRGQIAAWVRDQLKDQNLLRFLLDLQEERGTDDDLRLFRLIARLAPEQPAVWRGEALAVAQLLAAAAKAEDGDGEAGDWLLSLLASGVLARVQAPELVELASRWQAAVREFEALWQRAAEARAQWRRAQRDPDAVVDFDALVFGPASETFKRPADGRLLGTLLLAIGNADYGRRLAEQVDAALAAHAGHVPWLAELLPDWATPSAAQLAAGRFLLPHAQAAADEARQKRQRDEKAGEQRVAQLTARADDTLAALRATADVGLLSGEGDRQALRAAATGFLALAAEVRGLGQPMGEPLTRTVARAEPLVWRLQDRADAWEHAAHINALWQNRNLLNAVAIGGFVLFAFRPALLLYVLALPAGLLAWRLLVTKGILDAIRVLARSLPLRVPPGESP